LTSNHVCPVLTRSLHSTQTNAILPLYLADNSGTSPFFTARRYTSAVHAIVMYLSVCLSICLSIRLSQADTVPATRRITATTPYDSPGHYGFLVPNAMSTIFSKPKYFSRSQGYVRCKCGNISKTVPDRVVITINRPLTGSVKSSPRDAA